MLKPKKIFNQVEWSVIEANCELNEIKTAYEKYRHSVYHYIDKPGTNVAFKNESLLGFHPEDKYRSDKGELTKPLLELESNKTSQVVVIPIDEAMADLRTKFLRILKI